MENLVRLNKFISSNGFSSRRKVDELIEQGRVTVNGNTIVELGFKINPETDRVALDGENIKVSSKKIYIILNKPDGVVTTVADDKHRTTVIDLIGIREKIFPVGRLDYNTTGLLLLTNDGELANRLMHPKGEVYKTYFVKLSKPLEEKHRIKLTGGIKLEGKRTAPAKIRLQGKNRQDLYISIYEGRNRQVRNMFEHYGYFVRSLDRVEYAGLKLDGLKSGKWRYLNAVEIKNLNSLVQNLSDKPASLQSVQGKRKKFFKEHDGNARNDRNKSRNSTHNKDQSYGTYKSVRNTFGETDSLSGMRKNTANTNSKWGFKKRLKDERLNMLGFELPDRSYGFSHSKLDSGQFAGRDDKNSFRKNKKAKDKNSFNNFDKGVYIDDLHGNFGVGQKNKSKPFNKFQKSSTKNSFRKSGDRDQAGDFKKGFKKSATGGKGKSGKPNFERFDMRGRK